MIAPLCHLFSVTADILLEIDLAEKKEQIAAIIKEADALGSHGYNREAYDLLTDGHKRFPDDFEIMYHLMYNADCLADSDCSDNERTQYQNHAIQIAERTLESCTVDSYRHGAVQILCSLYQRIGKTDHAIELANSMPPIYASQEALLSRIGVGEKRYHAEKHLLDNFIQFLAYDMANCYLTDDAGNPYYSEDDNAALRDKQISFLTLMFEDGDFGFYHTNLSDTNRQQARYYAECGDTEHALQHLSKAAEHALAFIAWTESTPYQHTSLLFRGYTDTGFFSTSSSSNNAQKLLEYLKDSVFDDIRSTAEFTEITEKLSAVAANWDTQLPR